MRNKNNKEIKELKEEMEKIKEILAKYEKNQNFYNENKQNNKELCLCCGNEKCLNKCICGKLFCNKCISNNKNIQCIRNCYLFDNNLNKMTSHYQISKFPLPKNFKAKIHFIKVDSFEAVRVGITFDSNIINEKRYNYDEPPYK